MLLLLFCAEPPGTKGGRVELLVLLIGLFDLTNGRDVADEELPGSKLVCPGVLVRSLFFSNGNIKKKKRLNKLFFQTII